MRRPRLHRFLTWTFTAAAAFVLICAVANIFYRIWWTSSGGVTCASFGASFRLTNNAFPVLFSPGLHIRPALHDLLHWTWWFQHKRDGDLWLVTVPAWAPFFAFGVPALLMWRSQRARASTATTSPRR
jgi:hypothetical protein